MKHKFKTNLLIRDKRLDWMQKRGIKVDWKKLSDSDFEEHLRDKIVEEATEVSLERKQDGLVEEIGDVFEVIEYLMKMKDISHEEVKKAQDKKRNELGNFDDRVYTMNVEIDSNNEEIEYYFKNSHKYPEIKKRQCVRGIIRNGDKIMLLKRNKNGEEYYVFPGGGIEKGETKEQTLRREIFEEIGAEITNIKLLADKQSEAYYTCDVISIRKPTGDEYKNMKPNNTYEIVEKKISELVDLKLYPEGIVKTFLDIK
ncbi:MAG: NUDIX domain-containing protein [Alphaproteobacteria bacterium]|nr:MAG: hypothetical protein B6I23_00775 [Rickettsiaceae bacterium 4572_127]